GSSDFGWSGDWSQSGVPVVIDTAADPLVFATMEGGDQAISFQTVDQPSMFGRKIARPFRNDVYFSALVRPTAEDVGQQRVRFTFGNRGLYVGIDNAFDATDHFVAAMQDGAE